MTPPTQAEIAEELRTIRARCDAATFPTGLSREEEAQVIIDQVARRRAALSLANLSTPKPPYRPTYRLPPAQLTL
jgi:hypothetical protein